MLSSFRYIHQKLFVTQTSCVWFCELQLQALTTPVMTSLVNLAPSQSWPALWTIARQLPGAGEVFERLPHTCSEEMVGC